MLETARERAHLLRFKGEPASPPRPGVRSSSLGIASRLAAEGLEVSPHVLPGLDAALAVACQNLRVAREDVAAFVLPAAEIQATCYLGSEDTCTLSVTSALVQLLEGPAELAFVLGHEMGHFLLGHGGRAGSAVDLRAGRAKEVSADRLGLVAADDLAAALRAILKTVSGLPDKHLRHDVSSFLDAALTRIADVDLTGSTHPSMPLRARCLLRFDAYRRNFTDLDSLLRDSEAFAKFDQEVLNDVERLVEAPLIARLNEARDRLDRWGWTLAALADGALTRAEQEALREHCGADYLERLLPLLKGASAGAALDLARERLIAAIMNLEQLEPGGAGEKLKDTAIAIRGDGRIDGSPDALFKQILATDS